MPRYALTDAGDRVHVELAAADDDRTYQCPYCGATLTLAGGAHTQVRRHFRHRPDESCYDYDREGETARHLDAKSDIEYQLLEAAWADDIALEQQIGAGQPDVICTVDGDRVGIEVQVSSISSTELVDRTRQRSAEGLYTLWVFHAATYAREEESSRGNRYRQFKTGEQGYRRIVEATDSVWLHYFDPDDWRSPLVATRVDLFDDYNGGWPERTTPIGQPATYTTPAGYQLAAVDPAVPDETGDGSQKRLF